MESSAVAFPQNVNDQGRLKAPSYRGRQAKYGLCGQRLQTSCRGRNVGISLAGAWRLTGHPRPERYLMSQQFI